MGGDVLHGARDRFEPVTARSGELLQNELDRFELLLTDLLEISRFDAGAAVPHLQDGDPEGLAHRVGRLVPPLGDARPNQAAAPARLGAAPGGEQGWLLWRPYPVE